MNTVRKSNIYMKNKIHRIYCEGDGKRAVLELMVEDRQISAVMFNKVVDKYYNDFVVDECVNIDNYEIKNGELIINLEDDSNDLVDFWVTSVRDYDTGEDSFDLMSIFVYSYLSSHSFKNNNGGKIVSRGVF